MDSIEDDELIAPLTVDGERVLLKLTRIGAPKSGVNEEGEISAKPIDLNAALAGLAGVATSITQCLKETGAAKAAVEFGCDFALETGSLVAIIGKASTRSALKVTLEWGQSR